MVKKQKIRLWQIATIFMLSFVCICMAGSPVFAGENEGKFTIACSADDRFFISDSIEDYPIKISVKNNGRDFNGTIQMKMYIDGSAEKIVAYGQPAVIPTGETATFYFSARDIYFDVTAYKIPIYIDLLDENGNSVFGQIKDLEVESDGDPVVCAGVISDNDQIARIISSFGFDYETIWVSGKVTMQGMNMNSEDCLSMKLNRLDMMILDKDVTDEAWSAISDWLMRGGHLMMNEAVYKERIDKPLDEKNMSTWGTGKVLVYDQDKWNGDKMIRSVKELFNEREIGCLMGSCSYYNGIGLLDYDMWSGTTGVGKHLIILIIYILLLGPVAYIILKKKDRREYLWGVILCLAIIFSVVIFFADDATRYKDSFIRYISRVQITEEGNAEDTCVLVTSPDKDRTMLTVNGEYNISPVIGGYYWNSGLNKEPYRGRLINGDYDLALAVSNKKTDIIINNRTVFDEKRFSSWRISEKNGELESHLKYYRGSFSGRITNTTPWDLKNTFIIHKGVVLVLGDLPAGQSIDLDQAEAETVLYCADDFKFDTSVYNGVVSQTAANRIMKNMLESIREEKDGTFIGGFTEDYDIGLEESSQIESVKGLALIMQDIDVQQSGHGWSSQAVIIGDGMTQEDRDNYDSYRYVIYNEVEINLCYRLDGTCRPEYIRWLNPDDGMQLEFYNIKTGAYDRVFEDTQVGDGDWMAPYVDGEYEIKARVKVENFEREHFVPMFTVTGGEIHD